LAGEVTDDEFKYDVAFSFLGRDEAIARQLNDLVSGRVSTFIYSDAKRQAEIVGRDGEESFARVFGTEARTVVVLYRPGWGEAGFTAVEANAIRDRAHTENFNFTTFLLLEPPKAPKWLPRNRIWGDLATKGVEHAATVIESRILEEGGQVGPETAAAAAKKLRHRMTITSRRRDLLDSGDHYPRALAAFDDLAGAIHRIAESTGLLRVHSLGDIPGQAKQRQLSIIGADGWRSSVSFRSHRWDPYQGCHLIVQRYQPSSGSPGTTSCFRFDTDDEAIQLGWRECECPPEPNWHSPVVFLGGSTDSRYRSGAELADTIVRDLLSAIREQLED
jgi:hypothetical protein